MRATQCRSARDKPDGRQRRMIFALPQEQNAESPKHDVKPVYFVRKRRARKSRQERNLFLPEN
jgi:hypothetical protein